MKKKSLFHGGGAATKNTQRQTRVSRGGLGVALLLSLTLSVPAVADVNVYSARKEFLIKPLLDRFTAKTGIAVNLVTAKAGPLLKRLESEGRNTPADLFITTDAGRLHQARQAGVLQPVKSAALEAAVPANYRDADNYWYGLSVRARPILYIKDAVKTTELSTYEALADPRWKGRICIRGSGNIYNQSLVASMLEADGEAKTLEWLKGFVANFARKPKGGDRDQIKAAAAGECDIAIANQYYLAYMLRGKNEVQRAAASRMGVFWPNQSGRGAHVNVSGAGVTAASKNTDDAIKLLEFLVSDESQEWYADINNEYPVRADVKRSDLLTSFGDFKADELNLTVLGVNNRAAVKLMDRAGWQ